MRGTRFDPGLEDALKREWQPTMDRGLGDYTVHGVAESRIRLSDTFFQTLQIIGVITNTY